MKKDFDYLVCMCNGVSFSTIVNEIRNGASTFSELQGKLGVGSGCGYCNQAIIDILKKELEKNKKD